MAKSYNIENNTKHPIRIIVKEYDDESIVHVVLEDLLDEGITDAKTTIEIEKHTTRDS